MTVRLVDGFRRLIVLGIAVAVLAGPGGRTGQAQGATIEGVWLVTVTLRQCESGAQLGLPFNSLVTFLRGGTLYESTVAPAFLPGQRPPAHGTWRPDGERGYLQKAIALIGFTSAPNPPVSPGFEAGWSTITHRVEMVDADNMRSSGTNAFYRANGERYRTGCSTAVGRRFE